MQTYLITGGAGFIGSHFIDYLLSGKNRIRIINLDNLSYAGTRPYPEINISTADYHFIKGDICDPLIVEQIFNHYHPRIIINFAAESHVDRSIFDPRVFVHTNVTGTQVLLEAARCYEIELFVQISTDEVYGSAAPGQEFFTEGSPLKPSSPYSASKAAADLIVQAYQRTFDLPAIITRCTNNFGPRQYPEKLIPKVILNALAGKPIPVYGDGRQIRDWLFVTDHCAAIQAIINQGQSGEVYNIAGRHQLTNMEVINAILTELQGQIKADDHRLSHINQDLIRHIEDRKGHDRCYAINAEKTMQLTGFKPRTDFVQGIKTTVSWYLNNPEWRRNFEI